MNKLPKWSTLRDLSNQDREAREYPTRKEKKAEAERLIANHLIESFIAGSPTEIDGPQIGL
jgi:hypothetical protein